MNPSTGIVNGNRAVAYLDILGFSKMVETQDAAMIANKYSSLIRNIVSIGDYYASIGSNIKLCKQSIFSDSIFLIANEDSEQSFIDLICYTWRFLQSSIIVKMPLRGAICYGEVYFNEKEHMLLGKSIVNAVKIEKDLEWIGIVIDDSTMNRYGSILESSYLYNEIYNNILFETNVPYKHDVSVRQRALNWRMNLCIEEGVKMCLGTSCDMSVKKKIDNTLKFSKEVMDGKKVYWSGEGIPIQYRVLYGGKNPPPYKAVDEY